MIWLMQQLFVYRQLCTNSLQHNHVSRTRNRKSKRTECPLEAAICKADQPLLSTAATLPPYSTISCTISACPDPAASISAVFSRKRTFGSPADSRSNLVRAKSPEEAAEASADMLRAGQRQFGSNPHRFSSSWIDLTSLEPGTVWVSGRPRRTDLLEAARNSALEPKDVYCLLSRSSVLANRGSIPGGLVCRGETGRGAGL